MLINTLAFAQDGGLAVPDSLRDKFNNSKTVDSLRELKQKANLEALQQKVSMQRLRDSLNIQSWGDSVRQRINFKSKTDSLGLVKKIDSLQQLQLPTDKYKNKLDSVLSKREQLKSEIDTKQAQLQEKTTGRLKKWEQDARAKLKLDSLGINANANLPGVKNLSDQLPGAQLPGMPNVSLPKTGLELESLGLPEMPSLNVDDFSSLDLSPDLSKLSSEVNLPNFDGWKEISSRLGSVSGKVNEVSGIIKSPDKAAEAALGKVDEIADANKKLGELEELKNKNEALELAQKMKDEEAMKAEAKKQLMEKSIDHFEGKQELLKKSMGSLAKYKAKIPSLESLDKLPKHWNWPKNGLKGRPFRERFRPGLNVGITHFNDTLNIGFYPQAAYRITGRWQAGVGGYYQLVENKKTWKRIETNQQTGLTVFTVFKMVKSFHLRLEGDAVRTAYRSAANELPNAVHWRWTTLTGVQNVFKISNSISANSQLLYDFRHKFIHSVPERLVLRFGIEYTIPKKKVKKAEKN